MFSFFRALLTISLVIGFVLNGFSQLQDKEQSKSMYELAGEMLKASQAVDDVRDIYVQAADLDTTNLNANFQAGYLHLTTIKKEQAVKYMLRIYRQRPNYRFDLEYFIAWSYQLGLEFDKAIQYYNRYKAKYQSQPKYQGKDKVSLALIDRRIYECNNGKEFVAHPKPYAIVNLGSQVNSEAGDYAPVLNEKEDEIIFTSRRLDGNLNENVFSDNKPYEDIFISYKANGKWTRAANIGRTINIPDHNSNLAISADGKTLYSYRSDNGGDIYVSELKSEGNWSTPKPIPGVVNSPYYESSMSISPDGSTIYFASERPGGFGGMDLYVATKDNRGNWTRLKNLGPTINTDGHEDSPFIDYSGKKLYFSSEGHKGMGGYDIFETNLINPSKNEWSEPENLGYPINTPDNDIYYVGTADGKRGYYASVREDGLGYLDIYTIVPKDLVKEPTTVLPVKLVVKVIEAKTNTPLDATVELLSVSDSKPVVFTKPSKGNYTFSVTTKDPKLYRLSVSLEGYFPQIEEITLQSADMVEKTVSRTVGMAKSEKAPVIVPLKYVVEVVDSKTNSPLEAAIVKLQSLPENASILVTPKGSGSFEFAIISPTAKTYQLSVNLAGYAPQNQSVNLEGAGTVEKSIAKTVSLVEEKKEPVIVPLKYVVKVVNSKTNQPLESNVKLEAAADKMLIPTKSLGSGTYEFSIASKAAGDYKLSVDLAGYSPQSLTVPLEAATTTPKTISKTISLVEIVKDPVILPIKLAVKVVDGKTNLPIEANLKLEAPSEVTKSGVTSKAGGLFDFSISSVVSKEYMITAEKSGYVSKAEKFMIEGAGTVAKTINRTVILSEVKKDPIIIPLRFSIKVVDEKTNKPVEAKLKLETAGEELRSGVTGKATGIFDFTISSGTPKEYSITIESSGYSSKIEKINLEGAGTTAKTINRTVTIQPIVADEGETSIAVKLIVNVIDKKTNRPIDANVVLHSAVENKIVNGSSKGSGVFEFYVTSPTAKNYKLSVDKEGYVFQAQQLRIEGATADAKPVSRTIALNTITVGATSVLRNLYFDIGKAVIQPESYPELKAFENMMKKNPKLRVEVSGHTDNVGDKYFNKTLSLLRANAVKAFLVSKGIAPSRLVTIGYGETRPLVSNDDEEGGREINRRVELKILSK